MKKLLSAAVAFCVATVITQSIMLGYLLVTGRLGGSTLPRILAIVNGIDITGDRLEYFLQRSEDRELPDFDDVLRERTLAAYDMELRLAAQQRYQVELDELAVRLREDRKRFDRRRESFERELDAIREGAASESLQRLQRTLKSLEAGPAKDQLLRMFDDGKKAEVVTIIQAMSSEKRKEILAEFTGANDSEKLAEILRMISEGGAAGSLVEDATAP